MQIKAEKGKDKLIYYWHSRQPPEIESCTSLIIISSVNDKDTLWVRWNYPRAVFSIQSNEYTFFLLNFPFRMADGQASEWADRPVVFLAIWLLPLEIFRNRSFVHSTFLNNEAEKVASLATPKSTSILKFTNDHVYYICGECTLLYL